MVFIRQKCPTIPLAGKTLTGATSSGTNFSKLSVAVVEQAKKGDSKIKIVKSETAEE